MNHILKYLFILILSSLSQAAFATQCLVVQGDKSEDEKKSGAIHKLHPEFINGTASLAHLRCKYFDSWTALVSYVHQSEGKNMLLHEPLLVVQMSHGSPGGIGNTNAGDIPGETILKNLTSLSKNHPVFGTFESCYSGDLMKKKLINDALNPKDPSVSNLCLFTESAFNHGAEGGSHDLFSVLEKETKPGMSADDVFLRTDEGLISSAPWNQSGITDYFKGKELQQTLPVLQSIKKYGKYDCSPLRKASTQNCFKAVIEPILQNLLTQFNTVPNQPLESEAFQYLQKDLKLSSDEQTAELVKIKDPESKKKVQAKLNFIDLMRATLVNFKGDHLRDLILTLDNLSASLEFKVFAEASKPEEVAYQSVFPIGSSSSLTSQLTAFGNAESRMKLLLQQKDVTQLWADGINGPPISCSAQLDQRILVAEILGEELVGQSDTDVHKNKESPLLALFGFVRGGVRYPTFTDPIDQKRRNACRSFKF